MPTLSLGHIGLEAELDDAGNPTCRVLVTCGDKVSDPVTLEGVMTTSEVRALALEWVECAEKADQIATLLRVCRSLEIGPEIIEALIVALREERAN